MAALQPEPCMEYILLEVQDLYCFYKLQMFFIYLSCIFVYFCTQVAYIYVFVNMLNAFYCVFATGLENVYTLLFFCLVQICYWYVSLHTIIICMYLSVLFILYVYSFDILQVHTFTEIYNVFSY